MTCTWGLPVLFTDIGLNNTSAETYFSLREKYVTNNFFFIFPPINVTHAELGVASEYSKALWKATWPDQKHVIFDNSTP
jgi:hypothetical protein